MKENPPTPAYHSVHLFEFPPKSSGYIPFRQDRTSDTQGGGVFILVRDNLIATEQRQLKINCKIVWIKLELEVCKSV